MIKRGVELRLGSLFFCIKEKTGHFRTLFGPQHIVVDSAMHTI